MYDPAFADKIIDYIMENRVSTTEVGDCLNKTGAVIGSYPINRGLFQVGRIHYVYGHSNSNWSIHEQLRELPPDRVLFVDDIEVKDRALFGELVTMFIIEKRHGRAIVTKGLMRDAAELIQNNYPVWCGGITPEGCFNINRVTTPSIELIVKQNRAYYQDAIAVCDDCGVVVIPKEEINESMLNKLMAMEAQEKMWFHCVRDLDWDTYDTVCLKKYKENLTSEK